MPKTDIDYSNTIIYKITCKDPEIKDVYVGHTTNFVQRKHGHKQGCNNPKSSSYDCKLYNTIREKGGWTNWRMEIINFFNCYDHYEARQKEQEYFVSLNATLNSIEPMPKPKEKPIPIIKPINNVVHICDICKINCHTTKGLDTHNETNKHKKMISNCIIGTVGPDLQDAVQMDYNFTPKNAIDFNCGKCAFKCSKKSDWERHVLTLKHQTDYTGLQPASPTTHKYFCDQCGNNYKYRQGLWKHTKVCKPVHNDPNDDKQVVEHDPNLMSFLIKQNQEFKDMIVEQNKTIVDAIKNCSSNISNNQINSNNKTFNLQVFLNEDCKDAMNITDFVESIKFQLADLEHMGKVGYVDGISNIIIRNLKALDIHKRPVHCTDQKRETIYIKEAGVWTKEDEDNKNVRKLIKKVAFRNSKTLSLFKAKYPDCITSESKYSDTYSKIVIEAMGGGSKCNDYDSENKIIRKIAKEMTIDKNNL